MLGLSKNKIKWLRSLHLKKNRDSFGLFIVEGEKLVQEAIKFSPGEIELVIHTSDFTVEDALYENILVSEDELKQVSLLKTPNKALAILKKSQFSLPRKTDELILALDGIQDPGNLGTILRIADWFDIKNIICSNQTVEQYNPKVVQSSMGAIFRIQIHYTNLENWIKESGLPVYGALLEGENVYTMKLPSQAVLVLGNEGSGISRELIPLITNAISIPRFGIAESLNVSVAAGILVSEFKRKMN